MGISQCSPSRRGRKEAIPHDADLYRQRHKIENMFARLKDWRRISTRYDRCTILVLSACVLAATIIDWLKDAVTGPALRITITACQITAALSPFPYQTCLEEWGMKLFIGLDVSQAKTAICVVSEHAKIVREAVPLLAWLQALGGDIAALGL